MSKNLTEDQAAGLNTILKFIDDPDARTLAVVGYAGTGKTYLIQQAVAELSGAFSVAFTAPTNKATKVLREMAAESGISVDHVATIFSLLGLKLCSDGEVKEIKGGSTTSRSAEFDIVIVDEASMVGASLFAHLQSDMFSTCTKFIFMGDPLQLPPVGEERSKAFDEVDYRVTLTEIVRQAADNPIIQLTADIRKSIECGQRMYDLKTFKNSAGKGVYVLDKPTFERWMRAGFASDSYKIDGDSFRAIAWRNVTVDYLNRRIRQALYKENSSEPFLVGERVVNAAPLQDEEMEEVLAPTDSEGIIRSVEVGAHPVLKRMGFGEYKVRYLAIGYEEAGLVDAYVLHEDSERAFNRKLGSLAEEARKDRKLWSTFWTFKDSFHDLRPAHAITAHRSQGSTYSTCFVDVNDILRNRNYRESLQCLYVACSRASDNLILLK